MKGLPGKIGKTLKEQGKTLALAESCTGGYIAHLITSVSGSSAYFMGGVVAYDNRVKEDLLGVKARTLKKFGAVSAECAGEMAIGARKRFKTDLAIATTGIAGPTGAVKGKPVGMVYISWATKKGVQVKRFRFRGTRKNIIAQTAKKALQILAANL